MSLAVFLQTLLNAILILKEVVRHRILILKLLSGALAILRIIGGGFIMVLGMMWMGVLPFSLWTSAQTIPTVSPYSWAIELGTMILFGVLLEMFGFLAVGYGSMFLIPNTRFGRHFRYRVFVKKNKPSFMSQRMSYIVVRLFGQLRVGRAK